MFVISSNYNALMKDGYEGGKAVINSNVIAGLIVTKLYYRNDQEDTIDYKYAVKIKFNKTVDVSFGDNLEEYCLLSEKAFGNYKAAEEELLRLRKELNKE